MKKIIFIFISLVSTQPLFAQFTIVKDFNNNSNNTFEYNSSDGFVAKLGDKVFVQYDTTNSIPSTETLLSTIDMDGNREKIYSVPYRDQETFGTYYDFKELGDGTMAFVVNNSNTTFKIILTDGTETGTEELYSSSSFIRGMEITSEGLFFTQQKNLSSNYELMKINTTSKVVSQVIELGSFYGISDISKTNEGTLIFLASDPDDEDKLKVYSSDGTNAGTSPIALVYEGSGVSQQTVMTKVGSKVFFFYKEAGTNCCNYLWATDGTTSGTTKIKEFNTVFFIDYERTKSALAVDNKLYFMGVDEGENTNNERVLWVSDGTLVGTFALNTSSTFTRPRQLTAFNDKVYFVGYSSTVFNTRLYQTDGTVLGTQLVNIKYDATTISPYDLATDLTHLYLSGDCSGYGNELFRYNGTDLECAISEGNASSSSSNPDELFFNGTDFYFIAETPAYGREVFSTSTFTTSGTTTITESTNEEFYLYPNPANTWVGIKTNSPVRSLILLNNQGIEMSRTSSSTMNIENQTAGMYTVKITLDNGNVSHKKLIISK